MNSPGDGHSSLTKSAIRVAAAGLGAAVAGPLGGALGGFLAEAVGASAKEIIVKYAGIMGFSAGGELAAPAAVLL